MITLKPKLVTEFHRALATAAWVEAARAFVEFRIQTAGIFRTTDGGGVLTPHYNEERYMGPLSVVKYRFAVDVQVARGKGVGESDRYEATIDYDPDTQKFTSSNEHLRTVESRAKAAEELRKQRELERLSLEELASKEEFDRRRCPKCDSQLDVQFFREGQAWSYWCSQEPEHFYSNWRRVRLEPGGWWTDFPTDKRCPKCGSQDDVAGFIYGLIRDPEGIDRKLWELGGCMMTPDLWYCRRCGVGFIKAGSGNH